MTIMVALIGLLALALFLIFLVVFIVDLVRKKPAKKHLLISLVSLVVCIAMMAVPEDSSSDSKSTADTTNKTETKVAADTKKKTSAKSNKSGVTGVKPKAVSDPIKNFVYEIDGDKVKLSEYQGVGDVAEIAPSYTIDGKTYTTELDDGFGGAKTIILDEGITTVPDAFFNSTKTVKVYFPKSMTVVYDNTLAYLSSHTDDKIKIYYGGSQEQWSQIFQHYVAKNPSDLPLGEEKGKAWADKVNRAIGHEYNSDDFEYFFNAKPEDAR